MLYFTPYRISTITSNADIVKEGEKIKIDLLKMFNEFPISKRFVHIQFQDKEENRIRGEYPKKKRRQVKKSGKKRMFDNQVKFIYKMSDGYYPNIKVFQNGNIQMTGTRHIEHCKPIIDDIIDNIRIIQDKNVSFANFKIRLINTDFRIYKNKELSNKFIIKRKELHKGLIENDNIVATFTPGTYPGVKIEYYWNKNNLKNDGKCYCQSLCIGKDNNKNCKKITIAVFESGSVLITGAISTEQVDIAYEYICNFISNSEKRFENDLSMLMYNLD